jgi:RimJ/RimL family protein N-acetyltransferase
MNHLFEHPPTLENNRVLLKPLTESDFEDLCAAGADPELWQFSLSRVTNRAELIGYLQTAIEERARRQSLPFTIVDKSVNQTAGCTRFGNFSFENSRVEIGWTWIGKPFQRTGLNRACKYELLKFAFQSLGMIRVELKADALNLASREAMVKIGATEEGTLRKHLRTGTGRMRDSVYYSILAEEWPEIKQTRFAAFSSVK